MVRPGLSSQFRHVLLSACILLGMQVSQAAAGSVRLNWDANTEADLAGYVLVWGPASGVYSQSVAVAPTVATQEVTNLPAGTYYFAVRAFNVAGQQSLYSNEVVVVVPVAVSAPLITTVSPDVGPASGGTSVVLSGSGFVAGATVSFGGVVATVLQQTATSLTVRTPAHSAGTTAITVSNNDGGPVTRAAAFTFEAVVVPPLLPTVTSFAPALGPATGGTDVTITGTNFQHGVIVRFGAVAATVSSVTTTRLVARAPAQTAGVVTLTVLNPDGNGVQVPQAFRYRAAAPVVTTVTPVSGPTGGGTDVTVNGANFQAGVSVSVNSLSATVVSVTATRLVVRMPAHSPALVGLTIASGAVSVLVRNADKQSATAVNGYTYDKAAPLITGITPATGPIQGGTTVTITGLRLGNAPTVQGAASPHASRPTRRRV